MILGELVDGGKALRLDLPRLLESRLLVQANSGGGKSWILRRLLEQTYGKVPHLVLDIEDEFHTLREKHPYVLAGAAGADVRADVKTAPLLVRRILEHGFSTIVSIYEMKKHERMHFVRVLLEHLVEAPRALWRPLLVVVDEAHLFCPEKEKSEAAAAVIDLMTRGRKRGFCGVLATQRISKLNKDAAAEANNKLIGRSALDVDMKRAADELGFTGRDEQHQLRLLKPGEFFAFGPAIVDQVQLIKVGGVETTHPQPGSRGNVKAPPPPEKLRAILEKLQDLPKEAAEQEGELERLRRENADLRRKNADRAKTVPPRQQANAAEVRQLRKALEASMKFIVNVHTAFKKAGAPIDTLQVQQAVQAALVPVAKKIEQQFDTQREALVRWQKEGERLAAALKQQLETAEVPVEITVREQESFAVSTPSPSRAARQAGSTRPRVAAGEGAERPRSHQRILDTLAMLESIGLEQPTRPQLALWCDVSPTSGGFFNNLGALRSAGLIDYPSGGTVALSDDGRAAAQSMPTPSVEEMQAALFVKVGEAKAKILRELIRIYPEPVKREDLATTIGVSPTSGGYFNNLGALRTLGVIEYPRPNFVVAQPVLFLQ